MRSVPPIRHNIQQSVNPSTRNGLQLVKSLAKGIPYSPSQHHRLLPMLLVTLFIMTKALLLKLPLNYAIIHGQTKLLFIQKPHSA